MMIANAILFYAVMLPPPEFDRPYTGQLEIHYAEPAAVSRLCGSTGPIIQACAQRGDGWCRIIFPRDAGLYSGKKLDLLMRHEIAHCNGWTHDQRHR